MPSFIYFHRVNAKMTKMALTGREPGSSDVKCFHSATAPVQIESNSTDLK